MNYTDHELELCLNIIVYSCVVFVLLRLTCIHLHDQLMYTVALQKQISYTQILQIILNSEKQPCMACFTIKFYICACLKIGDIQFALKRTYTLVPLKFTKHITLN